MAEVWIDKDIVEEDLFDRVWYELIWGADIKLVSPLSKLVIQHNIPREGNYMPPFFTSYDEKIVPRAEVWGYQNCALFLIKSFIWVYSSVPMDMPTIPDSWDVSWEEGDIIMHRIRTARPMDTVSKLQELQYQHFLHNDETIYREEVSVSKQSWLECVLLSENLYERREAFKRWPGLAYK